MLSKSKIWRVKESYFGLLFLVFAYLFFCLPAFNLDSFSLSNTIVHFGVKTALASDVDIVSAANQTFESDQATTSISPIRITDNVGGLVRDAYDLAISIATSTFDFRFDTSDTSASLSGPAADKTDPHVTFLSDSLMKVRIYSDFTAGDYVDIAGLSYANFNTATTSQSGALQLYTQGGLAGTPDFVDSKTVTINGSLAVSEHTFGQTTNQWINSNGTTTAVHYSYSLLPQGESISVGETVFSLTGVSGVSTVDVLGVNLYLDYAGNGVLDNRPVLGWSMRLGGTLSDEGKSLALDSFGNIYVAGIIYGTVDLNGDADTNDDFETAGGVYAGSDIFLSKFNSSGGHLWSKRLGGASSDSGKALAIDSSDNVYIGGTVNGTADLNGDADTNDDFETAGGVYVGIDIFLSKFNSTGAHLWSKRLGGASSDTGNHLAIDKSENIYICGNVSGAADLNGNGDTSDVNEATGGVYANYDIFLSKFTSTGTYLWSERLGGAGYDYGNALATDSSNNVYVSGQVSGTGDLNGNADTSDSNEVTGGVYAGYDIFLSKFNPTGTHLWSERLGGASVDDGRALAIDVNDNIYLSGSVFGAADLNGNATTGDANEATGGIYVGTDIFLSKFSPIGNYLWSERLGGGVAETGNTLVTDISGSIYISGAINGSADLNGDADIEDANETAGGVYVGNDAFLVKFNSIGTHAWSERYGGASNDSGYALVTDASDNIYICGSVYGKADLNGDADIEDINEVTGGVYADADIFLTKFYNSDQLLSPGQTAISGTTGTITFATTSTYTIPNRQANIILDLTSTNIADSDQLTITLDSMTASGTVSGISLSPTINISSATHALGSVSISSNANQQFQIGQATTSISTIRITDNIGGFITANNDIYLSITSSTFSYSFDTTDTTASISGTAAGKADTTITFLSNSLLKIEITSDFALGEYIDLSGLSYTNFTNINTTQSGSLQLYTDNNYSITPNDTDDKTITIYGNIQANDHTLNQISNQWSNSYTSTTSIHYQYSLIPEGENMQISTTTFNLSGISGVTASDLTDSKLFFDYAGNGYVDSTPVFAFAKRLGGEGTDTGQATAIDSQGNIYVSGSVYGIADLNGDGDTVDENEATGGVYAGADIFLSKFNTFGIHLWSERLGGASFDNSYALATDSGDNIYISGFVNGSADLNGDADIDDQNELTGGVYSGDDIFVSKFSSSGAHLWSERLGGTNSDSSYALVIDTLDNIYIGGKIYGTSDLNGDADTGDTNESTGGVYSNFDIFLSKFSSTGTHLWSERLGGTSFDSGNVLTTDKSNNVYLSGYVNGTGDLNGDADTGDSNETTGGVYASSDIFLSKFSSTGTHLWSERLGGAGSDNGNALTTDTDNNIYISGYISGTCDLNGDADTGDPNETTGGVYAGVDIFLSKFSSTGTHLWSERLGGAGSDYGYSLDAFNSYYLTIVGVINGAVDLNGDADTGDSFENVGAVFAGNDIFVGKFSSTGAYIWSERLGGAGADYGCALADDASGNIYLSGYINGTGDLNGDDDTEDTNEVTGGIYASSDIFLTRFSVDSQIGSTGTIDIFGNTGTITFDAITPATSTFATTTTYNIMDATTYNFLLELTTSNIASGDQLTLNLASAQSLGETTGITITPSLNIFPANHYISSSSSADISSQNDQYFTVNQATTSISTIRISDTSGGAVTAANDIYLAIATSTFDYRFDTTDTLASLSGTASANANTTVTYLSDSLMLIDITSDFSMSDYLNISGLSYTSFNTATSAQSGALQMYLSGSYNGIASTTDTRLVGISASLTIGEHSAGQTPNQWINSTGTTTAVHYSYSLLPQGESISVGETVFALTGVSGVSTGDVSGASLYWDVSRNGVVDEGPVLEWSARLGGAGSDKGQATAVDSQGNIYITGTVNGTADFNGDGDTEDENEATGGVYANDDIFLSKFSSIGVHLWSERLGGAYWDSGYALATDASDNIYLSGIVNGNADLNGDADTGDANEATGGVYASYDIFLSKFNSSGTHLWSERLGGATSDYGYALATDASDNVYLSGYVAGNADLNGNATTGDANEATGGVYVGDDIFLSKFNSTGTHLWSERLGGAGWDSGYALATDASDNIYLSGLVSGTADLNGNATTGDTNEATGGVYAGYDIFLSKFNSTGTHLWSERLGGASSDSGYALATDASDNIYISGSVYGTADLNGNATTEDTNETTGGVYADNDIFLSKFNPTGTSLWSERLGGAGVDNGFALATDASDNIYISGSVYGTADLNGNATTEDTNETTGGVYAGNDIFLSKFNPTGTSLWSERLGGAGVDNGFALATDASDNIYLSGYVNGIADLNGNDATGDTNEATGGVYAGNDIFLTKFYNPDELLSPGQTTISDQNGTITFATSSTYIIPNRQANIILDLTSANIANSDQLSISLDSMTASGTVSGISISSTPNITSATHALDSVSLSSSANQQFQVGQATTSISTIRITDNIGGFITANDDIYLSIATSTFSYTFDTSDTSASISGTAAGKADTTISYLSNSLLKIEISSDFAIGEYIDISGLSYSNFTNINTTQSGSLQLFTDYNYTITPNDTDDKTITIYGNIQANDHALNQISNQWSNSYTSTTSIHYQYSLIPEGENMQISTTTFNLSGISGVTASDLASAKLYFDYAGNGYIDSTPVFAFAKRLGGVNSDEGRAIAVDSQGNTYITGAIYGNADLNSDGDVNDANEISGGIYAGWDIFISKFDSSGTHLWSERLGGAADDYGYALATDASDNVYISGNANVSADLNGDADTGDTNESTGGVYAGVDIFLSKFSPTGTHLWSERLGGAGSDYGYALATDASDNIYLSGSVNGSADLNGNATTGDANEATGGVYASGDIFLSKFSPTGTHIWSERLGGSSGDFGYALATDASDNIYLSGVIYNSADLNGNATTGDANETTGGVYESYDIFLSKFNPTGTHLWSERLGGSSWDFGYALATDASDNIYLSGYVSGTADLNGDADIDDANEATGGVYASYDIFLSKFDSTGTHLWSERLGGASTDYGYALATDASDNIYLSGIVSGTADLNGNATTGDTNETTGGVYAGIDIFLSKFDPTGTHLWSERLGGVISDYGYALATDASGNIYLSGYVNGNTDLNGDADTVDTYEAPSGINGNNDIFLTRFSVDSQIATGSIDISGDTGTISFATSTNYPLFTGTSTGFLLELTASNLASGDSLRINFNSASSTGAITNMSLVPTGNPTEAYHNFGLSVSISNHSLGQIGNQWANMNSFDGIHYRYRISPANGETIDIGTTTIALSGISGVVASDLANARLSFDTNSDNIPDVGQPSFTGLAQITGTDGTIVFASSTSYSISTSTDFLISLNAINLKKENTSFIDIKGNVSIKGNMDIKVGDTGTPISDSMTMDILNIEGAISGFTLTGDAGAVIHVR